MNYKFKPLNMKEHKRCPKCGKLMIKRMSNVIEPVNPPRYPWNWWCNCGNTEKGGAIQGISELQYYKKEWERVNNIKRCPESSGVDK